MAFDITRIEAVMTEITDPAVPQHVKDFLTAAEASGILSSLEARWPGISTASGEVKTVLDFLSKLDAAIVPFLPSVFKVLDALFPKASP